MHDNMVAFTPNQGGQEIRQSSARSIGLLYSPIFFNVQGGACQFLIDNDKVDHYI